MYPIVRTIHQSHQSASNGVWEQTIFNYWSAPSWKVYWHGRIICCRVRDMWTKDNKHTFVYDVQRCCSDSRQMRGWQVSWRGRRRLWCSVPQCWNRAILLWPLWMRDSWAMRCMIAVECPAGEARYYCRFDGRKLRYSRQTSIDPQSLTCKKRHIMAIHTAVKTGMRF